METPPPVSAQTATPAWEPEARRALLALCDPAASTPTSAAGWPPEAWDWLTEQAGRHGLNVQLHQAAVRGDLAPPTAVLARWKQRRLGQFVRNAEALAQLRDIALAAQSSGVRLLALKGAAGMLWLYSEPGRRHVSDIDLLIFEADVDPASRALRQLGYAPLSAYTSPEEELLGRQRVHLPPFVQDGRLPVELHLNVLERRGRGTLAAAEIWEQAVCEQLRGAPLYRPTWAHYLLHAATHHIRHLEEDFAPLKDLLDVVTLIRLRGDELDWPDVWKTADRWGVGLPVARVLRTAQSRWNLEIPGLPDGPPAISEDALVHGTEGSAEWVAGALADRLRAVHELPTTRARVRYLFRLVFPEADHLRWRYKVPEGASVAPYYVRHPFRLVSRAWRGLTHHRKRD